MEAPDHVSLLLRLALLESLTLGQTESQGQQAPVLPASNPALLLRSHNAESQFKESIEKYKSIVQFVNEYKDNKRYLQPMGLATPSTNYTLDLDGANGGAAAKKGQEGKDETREVPLLSAQSAIALLLEAEPDLKQLDRDLRMCEGYEGRSTAGAGKLADHEALLPRLKRIQEQANTQSQEDLQLESRVMQMMEQYSVQVDTVSRLFLHWDEVLTHTEDTLSHLERLRHR